MHAMRMGPGKHLQNRVLMNGLVTPEEFDYFHEVNFIYWNKIFAKFSLADHHPRVRPLKSARLRRWYVIRLTADPFSLTRKCRPFGWKGYRAATSPQLW